MGITAEFNPDLALREFGTEGREAEECLPERLVVGEIYDFLKKGMRLYYLSDSEWYSGGEMPLCKTPGMEKLSRPLASIKIVEVMHFLKGGAVWTKGKYRVIEVFDESSDKVNFEGYRRVRGNNDKDVKKVPRVGLGVIIKRGGKILLGKRIGSHGEGSWCFPGGHLEMFEGFGECAKRETMEETGLNIEVVDEIPIVTNDFFIKEGKHYITVFIRANYIDGEAEIMEKDKCEEWRWFEWDEMPDNLFVPLKNLKKEGYNPFER